MGFGDELMAAGMARGAAARGVKVAFGDGKRIIWGPHCEEIFLGNPNIARPGQERDRNIQWVAHYRGRRAYHLKPSHVGGRWRFNPDFRAVPGEMFFTDDELAFAETVGSGFVLVEPNVKAVASNKQWPADRWAAAAEALRAYDVRQFAYPGAKLLPGVGTIKPKSFRHALAALGKAALAILPEGGLHHGAAAVGIPAVVIFGGHTHPKTTGYEGHINLFTGGEACGVMAPCPHCRKAMAAIAVEDVVNAARGFL